MKELRFYPKCPWTVRCVLLTLSPVFQPKYRVLTLVEIRINFMPTHYPWANKNCISLRRLMGASLIAQLVKNLPARQETLVQFLGQEDALEKGEVTHSSILGFPL